MATFYADKPLRTWEIVWQDGRTRRFHGHQLSYPHVNGETVAVQIHGEISGQWRLVVAAAMTEIKRMREVLPLRARIQAFVHRLLSVGATS